MAELTELQYRFVDEYLLGHSATQAAIRAGYGESGAGVQAHRLLKNVNVKALIDERRAEIRAKYAVSSERVIEELGLLSFSNVKDLNGKTLDQMTREEAAAIKEISVETITKPDGSVVTNSKFKTADKHAPLKTLAQITGLLAQEGPPPQSVVFVVERSGGVRQIEGRTIDHDE